MPTLSRWCIKTGLIYFAAALILGIIVTFDTVAHSGTARTLWLVYLHLLVVGWITFLIVGVAFWLFPRYDRDRPYGPLTLGWTGYRLLNGGLLLRAAVEPISGISGTNLDLLLVISAIAQWLGGIAFVVLLWPRVREK
jgi:hypothetical protein